MLSARFLPGPRRRLFTVGFSPPGQPRPAHWVLVVPPFFEELNKSRRTLALLGRALAARGLGCLLPDLCGTGDSEGELSDAAWDTWIENLSRAHAWLLDQGAGRVDLLALRGGALLGWDWLAATGTGVARLILWHPVTSGRQLVQHLLRLRLAGSLMGRASRETSASLRADLARDGAIEIAGYRLSAALIASLEQAALGAAGTRRIGAVDWYQVVATPAQPLPPAVGQCTQAWLDQCIPTRVQAVASDAFWATQEIVAGTGLITATIEGITAAAQGPGRE